MIRSGHSKSIASGADFNTIQQYNDRPGFVLFGSGINPVTIEQVLSDLIYYIGSSLREIHLTGGRWNDGAMWHRLEGMGMGAPGHEWGVWGTSEDVIKAVRAYSDAHVR